MSKISGQLGALQYVNAGVRLTHVTRRVTCGSLAAVNFN